MTAAFSARRRADEFEALLSRPPGTTLDEREAARFASLLAVVSDLRDLPEVTARPAFVGDLRERLMAEAETALVPQPTLPQRLAMPETSRRHGRRLAVALGSAAMVGATATMAVASQGALPGESLYGVKRGIEAAQVRLADDDAARGRALLAQAGTRLDELEAIAADRGDERLVPQTLDTFTRQSSDGVRHLLASYDATGTQGDAQQVRDFAATSIDRLDALQSSLPASARDALVSAGQTLTDLDLDASSACSSCSGGVTTTPEFLLSSAPVDDLLSGLDTDDVQLETAPVSAQDLTGITVPPQLQVPATTPTGGPGPTTTPTPTPTPTTGLPSLPTPTPTRQVGGDGGPLTDVTDDVTGTVTDTTSGVVDGLDGLTGGAVGGLTGTLDNATGGLIDDVTGTVDGLTGGTLSQSTGGLLH